MCSLFQTAKTLAFQAYSKAAGYLATEFHRLTDPFDICIVTYALYTTGHRSKDDAFERMRDIARRGGSS